MPSKETPKPPSARWNQEKKMKLILQIMNLQATTINWANVDLPEGHDLKSCRNMLDGERRKYGMSRGSQNGDDEGNTPSTGERGSGKKATGTKASGSRGKKGATGNPFDTPDGENGDGTGPTLPAKKAAPRKRKSAGTGKVSSPLDGKVGKEDDSGEEKPKPKRKRATPKSKVKKEDEEKPVVTTPTEDGPKAGMGKGLGLGLGLGGGNVNAEDGQLDMSDVKAEDGQFGVGDVKAGDMQHVMGTEEDVLVAELAKASKVGHADADGTAAAVEA